MSEPFETWVTNDRILALRQKIGRYRFYPVSKKRTGKITSALNQIEEILKVMGNRLSASIPTGQLHFLEKMAA